MQRAVTASYGPGAKRLHWIIAMLVLAQAAIGLSMTRISGPLDLKFQLYQLHKSIGLTIAALMIFRLVWRLTHPAPPLPVSLPPMERALAHLAHVLLYALLLLLPITGWLLVSSASFAIPTLFFGLIPVPHLPQLAGLPAALRKPYGDWFGSMHRLFAYVLIALVLAHVLAALRHHFLLKDEILSRMLPARRGGRVRRNSVLAFLLGATAVLALAFGQARAADAPPWIIDMASSKVAFEASAGGQAVAGTLGSYKATIRFDPADPASADVLIEMDAHSITTGNGQIDQTLATSDWFDADAHPTMSFAGSKARKTGEGTYELEGELSIRGTAKAVVLPFTFTMMGDAAKVEGEVTVSRLDFGLGAGIAASAAANEVKVMLSLTAKKG